MALSRVTYTQQSEGLQNFSVPFDYISEDHIKVYVDGEEVGFSFLNESLVRLDSAPALAALIEIVRETSHESLLVDYQDGSVITEEALDTSAKHALYFAQEAYERVEHEGMVAPGLAAWNARGKRISNVGAPQDGDDAVRWKDISALSQGIVRVFVGSTAPVDPLPSMFWFDTLSGRIYFRYYNAGNPVWVESSPHALQADAEEVLAFPADSESTTGDSVATSGYLFSFDGVKWTSVRDVVVDQPATVLFSTVADLKAGVSVTGKVWTPATLATAGVLVKTLGFYAKGDGGGGEYLPVSLAKQRDTLGDPSWTPDGCADHTFEADSAYAAVLQVASEADLRQFGAVAGEDITESLASAMGHCENKKLVSDSELTGVVSAQIVLPSKIELDLKGKMNLVGDEDYWFNSDSPERILIHNFEAEVSSTFASRALLNRVIRVLYPVYFEVERATITGASTAIHALEGEDAVFGTIILKNVKGTAAQAGYGVNSSCVRTTIMDLRVENDDTDHGRHAVYINGDIWESVFIANVSVRNWARNPIQITNTSPTAKCSATVGNFYFENCNITPIDAETGCIHFPGVGSSGNNVTLGFGRVRNIAGPAVVSKTAGYNGFRLEYLHASDLPQAASAGTSLVYLRNGAHQSVGTIICEALNTNWTAALYVRDAANFSFDYVNCGGTLGSQAVRLVTSTVDVGRIKSPSIQPLFNSGSDMRSCGPWGTTTFGGAPPTTGTWVRGDVLYDSTPSAGGNIGWVCVSGGTFGVVDPVFKAFGTITV